jgi:para-aminobenzoate synthetase component 1
MEIWRAYVGGRLATGLQDVTSDLGALDSSGFWVVVVTFEGAVTCARFSHVRPAPLPTGRWAGVDPGAWSTSLSAIAYQHAVEAVRAEIADGNVYQVNVCRVLTAELPDPPVADPAGLAGLLATGNPAPYAALVELPGLAVVSASPERFLTRRGDLIESSPIKGTGRVESDLTDKDRDENVMIVDLVRNDLGQVCRPGSIDVPELCRVEAHPGLVHLVSTVTGRLDPGVGWAAIFAATFPPGSVSGAPKSSALRTINGLEPVPRGPYCGAVGWVDAEARTADLAVGIRTFWMTSTDDGVRSDLHLGVGAGITWASDPEAEWRETELKAATLLRVASATTAGTTSR